jgi:hypothetical protein
VTCRTSKASRQSSQAHGLTSSSTTYIVLLLSSELLSLGIAAAATPHPSATSARLAMLSAKQTRQQLAVRPQHQIHPNRVHSFVLGLTAGCVCRDNSAGRSRPVAQRCVGLASIAPSTRSPCAMESPDRDRYVFRDEGVLDAPPPKRNGSRSRSGKAGRTRTSLRCAPRDFPRQPPSNGVTRLPLVTVAVSACRGPRATLVRA